MYEDAKKAGMFLLDSPISGGNPMAIAGTLAIMTGGDKEAFEKVKPLLECLGNPVYTGSAGSGSVTSWSTIIIAGAYMVVMAEGYAFAAKAALTCRPPLKQPAAASPAALLMTTRCPRSSTAIMNPALVSLSIARTS